MDKEKIYGLIKPVIIAEVYQFYLDNIPFAISPNYDFRDAVRAYQGDTKFNRQVDRCMAKIMLALDEKTLKTEGE